MKTHFYLAISVLLLSHQSRADIIWESNVVVQTFVGSGFYGLVDGTGVETMFNQPTAIAFAIDSTRTNLFISDFGNQAFRYATTLGELSTIRIMSIGAANTDRNGDCWFLNLSAGSSAMLRVTANAIIDFDRTTTFVTNTCVSCRFAFDSANRLYASVPEQNRIFVLRTNYCWEVFVGSGNPGNVDGRGIFSSFLQPRGLAFDSADNLYVADFGNLSIRKVAPDRTVATFLEGRGQDDDGIWPLVGLSHCGELVVDSFGNIYVAQRTCVRKVTPSKTVTTVAGYHNASGFRDGDGRYAMFRDLASICLSPSGDIYVADRGDHRIRRIILSPTEQPATSQLQLAMYPGLSITGVVGRTYRIETATNLNSSNWTPAATIQLPESPHLWIDRDNAARQRKFYRAFILP